MGASLDEDSKKSSDHVKRLADEIMSLSLLEAAELCDLCQDKLAPGDDTPIPGRMPFPHPMAMFPGPPMPMQPGMAMPVMPQAMPAPPASNVSPTPAVADT